MVHWRLATGKLRQIEKVLLSYAQDLLVLQEPPQHGHGTIPPALIVRKERPTHSVRRRRIGICGAEKGAGLVEKPQRWSALARVPLVRAPRWPRCTLRAFVTNSLLPAHSEPLWICCLRGPVITLCSARLWIPNSALTPETTLTRYRVPLDVYLDNFM